MKPFVLLFAVSAGCIAQIQNAISPSPPTSYGTSSCREIVETCDRTCTDPFCIRNCTAQGTAEAQAQHTAVVDCAQRNACTDEACVRASCAAEASTCEGPAPAAPLPPPQSE